jgi:alpha-beta hydrolase superfamily lysophospholipase
LWGRMTPELISLQHTDGYKAAARWWPGLGGPGPDAPFRDSARRTPITTADTAVARGPADTAPKTTGTDPAAHGRTPAGAVLYLHGIQSHGEWFERSGGRLAAAGLAVLLPDRRGSGRNERDRGHAESAEQLLGDAEQWLDELQRRSGCERIHIVGVSWGGKLALNLFQRRAEHVASLALVAPGLFPIVDIPLARKVRVAWSAVADQRRLFDIPINEPDMFTANPCWIEYLQRDPLRLRQVTASFLVASRRLDRFTHIAHRHAGAPIALFLAEYDRIIDNERTRRWLRELPWPGRRLIEYRGAHHTLEFETVGCSFVDDLVEWVKAQRRGCR